MKTAMGNLNTSARFPLTSIAQKMTFPIMDFSSKCNQISSFLRIWSHLLNKSLMENFFFLYTTITSRCPFFMPGNKREHLVLMGYNRMGYNRMGYNRMGYDRMGYNRSCE